MTEEIIEPKLPPPVVYKFSLNAELTLTRNNLPLALQAKNSTKVFTLSIKDPKHLVIHCVPTNEVFYQFSILNVKVVHSKFISEGKVTIVVKEGVAQKQYTSLAMSIDGLHTEDILVQIMVDKGVPSSLQLLLQKMNEIIEKAKEKLSKEIGLEEKKVETKKQMKRVAQEPVREQVPQRFSRKSMLKQALQEQKKKPPKEEKPKPVVIPKPQKSKKNIFNLVSLDVLLMIFSFSKVSLQYRLLSKDCSNLVLSGLSQVRLKPDIPQQTFEKLTKYTLRITCRMRNVRSLAHVVNNSIEGPLLPTNCKWYNFSDWREMKNKHLNELVGIRLYYLSINYLAAISSQTLKNLKMSWLCLTSSSVSRNLEIKDEDIMEMINGIPDLMRLEITCFNGDLLREIEDVKKIRLLKIERMDVGGAFDWKEIEKFEELEVLEIGTVVNRVTGRELSCSEGVLFPSKIQTLRIGEYFDITKLNTLPQSIQNLTLINQRVRNVHMFDMALPILKRFDISRCPLLSPEGFQLYTNLDLIVQWDKFLVDEISKEFKSRGIRIINLAK